MLNLKMFPSPPSLGGSDYSHVRKDDEGGRNNRKENEQQKLTDRNNEAAIAISTWLLNK